MSSMDYRHQFIIDQIENRGSVNVVDLANNLDVSETTIRRDFNELEKLGLIRRFHGGAVSARGRAYEPPLLTRTVENQHAKELIGRYAAKMVCEGDSISLDVGSTVFQVAKNLTKIKNITLITPSLQIAQLFYDNSDIRLIIPGGIVRPSEHSLIGEITRRDLGHFFVDRLFLAAGAIDIDGGVTEFNMDDALIKQALIQNANEVVLVADSSKFQKTSFCFVTQLNKINHLITDTDPPEIISNYLQKNGVVTHIVTENHQEINLSKQNFEIIKGD